jgi:hypothetical protein
MDFVYYDESSEVDEEKIKKLLPNMAFCQRRVLQTKPHKDFYQGFDTDHMAVVIPDET